MKLDLVVLTFNEEIHIRKCIESVLPIINKIFVIDSGSTDCTLEICKEYNAKILHNDFIDHPHQWKFALENIDSNAEWILCLDADQFFPYESIELLINFSENSLSGYDGIYINRKNIFRGQWIKYGGYFPKYMLKIVRKSKVTSSLEEKLDHRLLVPGACMIHSELILVEENLKENDLSFWLQKHIKYSLQVAESEFICFSDKHKLIDLQSSPDRNIIKRKIIWKKLPLYWRSLFYFIYRFIFKLGFLDGREGRIFHFLHSLWFRLLVDHRIVELRSKNKKNI